MLGALLSFSAMAVAGREISAELDSIQSDFGPVRRAVSLRGQLEGSSTPPTADQQWQVERAWTEAEPLAGAGRLRDQVAAAEVHLQVPVRPVADLHDDVAVGARLDAARADQTGLGRRPEREDLRDRGRGEEYQSVYLGLRYELIDNRLVFMTGAEWFEMKDTFGVGGGQDGFTFLSPLRFDF